jgi:hypothetical protein
VAVRVDVADENGDDPVPCGKGGDGEEGSGLEGAVAVACVDVDAGVAELDAGGLDDDVGEAVAVEVADGQGCATMLSGCC